MLSVIVGTSKHILDDGELGLLVAYDGWGMPPSHRISSRGHNQHGETDLGFRLDPRFGTIVFEIPASDLSEMYTKRSALLSYFNPKNDLKLLWELPNGKNRQINCVYSGDMTLPWDANTYATQRIAITLKASDPTFYDPAQALTTIPGDSGGTPWAIAWSIPWTLGGTGVNVSRSINYEGTFLTYPIVTINGPITDPVVTNTTTGEKLDFTGTTLLINEWLQIDTRYGLKTVVDELGVNQISALSDDSDLSTFHIAPDNEAPGGVNAISFTGSSAGEATNVKVQFYTRYVGL